MLEHGVGMFSSYGIPRGGEKGRELGIEAGMWWALAISLDETCIKSIFECGGEWKASGRRWRGRRNNGIRGFIIYGPHITDSPDENDTG